MDIEAFTRREKMLKLREELLAVEEDRLAGRAGVTPDELNSYLDSIIEVNFNFLRGVSLPKTEPQNGILPTRAAV